MEVSVIEYKIDGELYCFSTKNIAYVFELEDFTEINGFHESVLGIVKYNNDTMPLIDTSLLFGKQKMKLEGEKSVIVLQEEDTKYKYGILVDKIIKLEEVQKIELSIDLNNNERVVNHYKNEDEKLVNEVFPLPLLKKYHIPAMSPLDKNSQDLSTMQQNSTTINNYLIVQIKDGLYAIKTDYIQEVVENEFEMFELPQKIKDIKGAISLRNRIIPIIDFVTSQKSDIVIIQHSSNKLALEVDTIHGIEDFHIDKIDHLYDKTTPIKAFYSYNNKVIAIINPFYFFNKLNIKKIKNKLNKLNISTTHKKEFLVFQIEDKKYTIPMEHIRQVVEIDELAKTHSSAIGAKNYVEFIATWQQQAISIIKLDSFLHITTRENDIQVIVIEKNNKYVAIIVNNIENIIYINQTNISQVNDDVNSIFSGAVLHDEETIAILNSNYLIQLA